MTRVAMAQGGSARLALPFPVAVAVAAAGLVLGGCAVRPPPDDAFPHLAEHAGREIVRLRFVAPEPFTGDTLAQQIRTESTHCRILGLPLCLPWGIGLQRRYLRVETVRQDVDRLERFYRRAGFHDTEVIPVAEPVREGAVVATFAIQLGTPIILDELALDGLEGIIDADSLRRQLPLQRGELFNLERFSASSDTVLRMLRRRGHAFAEVLRSYDIDPAAGSALAGVEAVSGPVVQVDSILIFGAEQLGRRTVERQLEIRPGELLVVDQLVAAQRNLYGLELVQFATVDIADDTLQIDPTDRSRATLDVRVSEAPVHRVEAAVGYGRVDCFRAQTEWVSRNFLGNARRLTLFGGASKLGIQSPLDVGDALCPHFREDPELQRMDYRLAADLTQPWFLSPRNRLTASAFTERQSVPEVFQREAVGGRLSVGRRLRAREAVTAAMNVEYGRTVAVPGLFCAAFQVCLPEDIRELGRARWRNSLGLTWVRDRSEPQVDPRQGYMLRSSLGWMPRWMGADVSLVRLTGEASVYRGIGRRTVAGGFLRLGTLIGRAAFDPEEAFLPPEERFYAGGATTVRGFDRNALGPGVYVIEDFVFDPDAARFVPIGGRSVVLASAEVRLPAPFARDLLRSALFLDAGAVSAGPLWELRVADVRMTPGAGVRIRTPVGPARVDLAFNPHPPELAPLYLRDELTDALVRTDDFRPEPPGFLGRFRLHLAVGHAF